MQLHLVHHIAGLGFGFIAVARLYVAQRPERRQLLSPGQGGIIHQHLLVIGARHQPVPHGTAFKLGAEHCIVAVAKVHNPAPVVVEQKAVAATRHKKRDAYVQIHGAIAVAELRLVVQVETLAPQIHILGAKAAAVHRLAALQSVTAFDAAGGAFPTCLLSKNRIGSPQQVHRQRRFADQNRMLAIEVELQELRQVVHREVNRYGETVEHRITAVGRQTVVLQLHPQSC